MQTSRFKVIMRFLNAGKSETCIHCDSLSEVISKATNLMRLQKSDAELSIRYCNSDGELFASANQKGVFLFG